MLKATLKRAMLWAAQRVPADTLAELQRRTPGDLGPRVERLEGLELDRRVADLEAVDAGARVGNLERHEFLYDTLFFKAFSVAGLGDYLEFGVFTGGTLANAYRSAAEFHRLVSVVKAWGDDGGEGQKAWDAIRFFGFDSFKGLPTPTGPDADRPVFSEGEYAAGMDQVSATLEGAGVDTGKVRLVEGFFEETCTSETAERLGLTEISVVHIDSDLYESAVIALDFCTPHLREGSVVIFDEWFQFAASPEHGEQRAFREWLGAHPEWRAAELAREGAGRMAFVLTRRPG